MKRGIKPAKLSGRMGHANVRTTLDVYVHLFPDDDATEDMAALGALARAEADLRRKRCAAARLNDASLSVPANILGGCQR